jgi:hypothetical protein
MTDSTTRPSSPDGVASLVMAFLDRVEAGEDERSVLEALCEEHPEASATLRRRLSLLREMGVLTGEPAPTIPQQLGEFRLLAPLGGGGMGMVFHAEQLGLGRQVALKVVHPAQLYLGGARERFQREVETIAKLQHPGIVPVHAVGEQDGVPYLVMERVQGATLQQVLSQLEGRSPPALAGADFTAAVTALVPDADTPADPGWALAGTWEEACLAITRQVAEALHHAHRRGVVHRDVKPSNIMLTADGRALLLDFGLASSEGAPSLTKSGSPLGSLPYMAPEQTRGAHDEVDARTDVYGLGVTLYELLTIQPAFGRSSAPDTLADIQQGRREAPRQRVPSLSWEAETVCLTAMDPDPARRYASCAEFGRDLANVLEHQPIDARRAGAWLRARRWAQRRPAAAVALVMGTLLLVGGPSVFAWQQLRAAEELREEQVRTDAERLRAEGHLTAALAAVDAMLVRVGDESLRFVPQMESLRRELLDEALAFHRGFLATEGERPELVLATARTLQLAGEARHQMGRYDEAEALHAESVDVLERLLEEHPGHAAATAELALSLRKVAVQHRERGERAEARALNDQAIALQKGAVSAADSEAGSSSDPDDATAAAAEGATASTPESPPLPAPDLASVSERAALGITLNNQAGTIWDSDPAGAEAALLEARDVFTQLVAEVPENPGFRHGQGMSVAGLAAVLASQGRVDEARPLYDEAITLFESVLAVAPEITDTRSQLAMTLSNAGLDLIDSDPEAARAHMQRALEVQTALATDFPATALYRMEQARTHTNLGFLASQAGDDEGSEAQWRRSEALQSALIQDVGPAPPLRASLALTYSNLADSHARQGELAEARDAAVTSIEIYEELLLSAPGDPVLLAGMSEALHNMAHVLELAGELALAEQLILAAMERIQAAMAANPLDAGYPEKLGEMEARLTDVRARLAKTGQP